MAVGNKGRRPEERALDDCGLRVTDNASGHDIVSR